MPIKNPFKANMHGFVSRSIVVLGLFSIVVIASIGVAVYFYMQYQKSQILLQSPTRGKEQDATAVIGEVGKLIELPVSEQPTIATVSDIMKLKGQSFFAHAKNGDKVLIYTKAKKAILYDPVVHKIVEVGPINLTQPAPTTVATPTSVRVALYNGTKIVGLTTTVAQQLKKTMPIVTVTARANAHNSTYTTTLVVDLTGKEMSQAEVLAKSFGGNVGSLPADEVKPHDADMLVILGK